MINNINLYILKSYYLLHDINHVDRLGKTPLIKAAELADLNYIKILLKLGADINKQNKDGVTALILSCISGHLNTAKFLIENGANIEAKWHNDEWKMFSIPKRVRNHNEPNLPIFPVDPDFKEGITALEVAVINKNYSIVKLLLDYGADPNLNHSMSIRRTFSIKEKKVDLEIFKLLLSYNVNLVLNNPNIFPVEDNCENFLGCINDHSFKLKFKPYFDTANSIDHLVEGNELVTEEDRVRLASIEDKELLEVAASRFKVALMSKLTDLPKITQKYLKTTFAFEKLKEIQKEHKDEQLNKFFYKILNEPTKFNKQEELAAKLILEEIAQLESMLLSAKIYRAAGENEKKILTYDTLRTALEFNSNRDEVSGGVADDSGSDLASFGTDASDANTSKDSPEIKAYKEMLAIYEANPNYKKVGYILQEAIGNLAELKKTFAILTGEDKAVFAAHLSNLLAKEPEIFLDEAKEALCELCGGIDITHASLQEFTEHHDPHEPSATDHHTEGHHLPADNMQLAGSASGVGFIADNH